MGQQLNSEQKRAVEAVRGRVLILAGAGSGKTRVLTLRMVHLIRDLHVPGSTILGLTFTNKAAREMRHRVASLLTKQEASQITLCTFHSFCMQLLRAEISKLGYTSKFSLYNEKDVSRLISLIARDLLDREGELPSLSQVVQLIHFAKNRGLSPEQLPKLGLTWQDQFSKSVYERLEVSLRAYNAVDFDTLIGLSVELFEKFPEVLNKYQDKFRYIMIDEYQDTNPIQDRLAHLLAKKYQNICVVGDDDQSIYGWRGADVKNILEFPADHVIKLERNYRSNNCILKAANAIIDQNTTRHKKKLWSDRGMGDPIEVFHAPGEKEEAEAVLYRLVKIRDRLKLSWKDIAILYRSNALSRPFELALKKYRWQQGDVWRQGIPYQVFGGTEFYERREVKDLLAYMRLIANNKDQEAILRVINQPRRGIGEGCLDLLTSYGRLHHVLLWDLFLDVREEGENRFKLREKLSSKAKKGISVFVNQVQEAEQLFIQLPLDQALTQFVQKIQFKKSIEEEVKSEQMRQFKWQNVQEFITSLEDFKGDLMEATFQFALEGGFEKQGKGELSDAVNLMTFHSAKGLEFPVCFLVGMEDHIIPHEKSLKETGIEEERRLMYVAITRAKDHLILSMAQQRKRLGQLTASRPSRFLFDIPKELIRAVAWDL